MSPGAVDCRMKTAKEVGLELDQLRGSGISQQKIKGRTIFVSNRLSNRDARFLVRIIQTHRLCDLNAEPAGGDGFVVSQYP